MIYGDSGDGKSTDLHSLARYYYEVSGGLPVRLVSFEDSSKQVFADLIDAGIVEAVFLTASKSPLVTVERIAEGEWPTPGEVNEKGAQIWQKKTDWSGKISAYIWEGATTVSEVIADYLRENGKFPREQKDAFDEGGRTFMAASQTAIYFTQTEVIKLIKVAGMLPVLRVAWSAHEAKGKDEFGTDGAVRGPRLIGSAATDTVRKYVGVLFHKDRIKNSKGDEEYRVYVANHPDPKNPTTSWKARVTLPPTKQLEFQKQYPNGYFVTKLPQQDSFGEDDGIIPFLKFEQKLRESGANAANEFKARIAAQNKA